MELTIRGTCRESDADMKWRCLSRHLKSLFGYELQPGNYTYGEIPTDIGHGMLMSSTAWGHVLRSTKSCSTPSSGCIKRLEGMRAKYCGIFTRSLQPRIPRNILPLTLLDDVKPSQDMRLWGLVLNGRERSNAALQDRS